MESNGYVKYVLQMQTGVCGLQWTFSFHAEDDAAARVDAVERYLSEDNLTERTMSVILWDTTDSPEGRFVAEYRKEPAAIKEVACAR